MADRFIKKLNGINNMVGKYVSQFGRISSISGNGKTANMLNIFGGEIRDLKIMLPYGISSSAVDGAATQAIVNDSTNNSMVGVYDYKRPDVKPGELILYNKYNARILLGDGKLHAVVGSINDADIPASKGKHVEISDDGIKIYDDTNINMLINMNISGDISITNDNGSGSSIKLKSNGDIDITGNKVNINGTIF